MCGIAGFFRPAGLAAADARPLVEQMSSMLRHRGPDDSGHWIDADAGIAFGHTRLSILDLSQAGHQPMASASGRYVMIYNGEIYNHPDLRRELESCAAPPQWRGHSDTEILLAGFDQWGIEPCLRRSVGMFALALWDRQERTLTLARDRVGEKPLYYGWQGDELLFGSELKALRAHPRFRAPIDRSVLALYLRDGYITAPHSIFRGIFRVEPGTFVQFCGRDRDAMPAKPGIYWSLREVAERGVSAPFTGGDAEAIAQLDAELSRAVAAQRLADVPLGAFLSGGLDSSTVVALMQAQSSRPVHTFTIGFRESAYNEAHHARAVAQQLGTEHTELFVTADEVMQVLPRLASLYDEPFGDSSAIPTFLVSQLARRQVTVALSGDGGDELFCGYARYQRTADIWAFIRRLPPLARRTASLGARAVSRHSRLASKRARAARLAQYLTAKNAAAFYRVQTTQSHDAHALVLDHPTQNTEPVTDQPFAGGDLYSLMTYVDIATYLPDNILVKVDRASMAVGLETRVPLLDHRVVEFACRLPLQMKVRGRTGKWILRQVLRKYLPAAPLERPKMGFGVPVLEWVRGPLREWAESLLSEERLRREGFLNPRLTREHWLAHLAGDSRGSDSLWHVLAFQSWLAGVS